jgi:hypothetical protein
MGCVATESDPTAVDVADSQPAGADAAEMVSVSNGVADPSAVKVTAPDGSWFGLELGELGQIVALNVTIWPNTDGLAEEPTMAAVGALFTVSVKVPTLDLKLPSPL